MAFDENRPNALKRVTTQAHSIIFSKFYSAVTYGAAASIYKPITIAGMELNSPQCLLLGLLYSLVAGDVMFCLLLITVSEQIKQLNSKYLKVWLTEDFVFPRQDMEKAMTLLGELVATGVIKLPPHLMRIMSFVAVQYGITGVWLISSFEDSNGDLAIEMENAVSNNNPAEIITLVMAGGDVNNLTQSGDRLPHVAARTGSCASIAALGFLKADLEIVNSSMATPLEIAVRNNDVLSVRALLMAGAKIDKLLLRGDTYLHLAAAGGKNEVLQALLEGGIKIDSKNHLGETPLFQAVKAENVHGVELLLQSGADINVVPVGWEKSLVEIAVESQNVALFKVFTKGETLLAFKFKNSDSILHVVAKSGNFEMLNFLRDQRLTANQKNIYGITPLHVASDISVVRILLGMNCIIDEKDTTGCTALMIAAKNSKPEIATLLLCSGANPFAKDNHNKTPLHYAAAGGDEEIVNALLKVGARLEEKNNEGMTPAFVAAVNNKVNSLELLIEHGADKSVKDNNGDEMIHRAAFEGLSDIVSVLLGFGVMVDVKGKGGCTPLHYAAEKGHVSVVSVLLNHGADVTAMTNIYNPSYSSSYQRWTPLIAASKVGNLDVVKLLLDEGAPVNDRDNYNSRTALGWALYYSHTSVADYLRSVGGAE